MFSFASVSYSNDFFCEPVRISLSARKITISDMISAHFIDDPRMKYERIQVRNGVNAPTIEIVLT